LLDRARQGRDRLQRARMTDAPEPDDLDVWVRAHSRDPLCASARERTTLMLSGEGANDSAFCRGLHLLAGSPSLGTLRISKADLRGRALEPLRACSHLRSLSLDTCALDEGPVASLRGAEALADLQVWEPVGDAALARVAELASLEWLYLDGELLTDAGLAHLARLTTLRALDVRGAPAVTDRGAAALEAAEALTRLSLTRCR